MGSGDDKQLKGAQALAEIGRRLGDLARDMKTAFDTAPATGSAAEASAERHTPFTIETPRGPVQGVVSMGLRTRPLSGGSSGASRPTAPRPQDREVRRTAKAVVPEVRIEQPAGAVLDVVALGDEVMVAGELPGVDAVEVAVIEDRFLVMKAGAAEPIASARLPAEVDPESVTHTLVNGIFDGRVRRRNTTAG